MGGRNRGNMPKDARDLGEALRENRDGSRAPGYGSNKGPPGCVYGDSPYMHVSEPSHHLRCSAYAGGDDWRRRALSARGTPQSYELNADLTLLAVGRNSRGFTTSMSYSASSTSFMITPNLDFPNPDARNVADISADTSEEQNFSLTRRKSPSTPFDDTCAPAMVHPNRIKPRATHVTNSPISMDENQVPSIPTVYFPELPMSAVAEF